MEVEEVMALSDYKIYFIFIVGIAGWVISAGWAMYMGIFLNRPDLWMQVTQAYITAVSVLASIFFANEGLKVYRRYAEWKHQCQLCAFHHIPLAMPYGGIGYVLRNPKENS